MQRIKVMATLLLLSISMANCTSAEEQARVLHSQALEARKAGDTVKQEELVTQIVQDYRSTTTGAEARKELEEIKFNKEVLVSNTVGNVRLIIAGQVLFLTAHGRYARDLDELCADKRGGFDRHFLDPQKGYRYEMTAEDEKFAVTATPTLSTLQKHFFGDNSGLVHEETGKPATPESPLTEY